MNNKLNYPTWLVPLEIAQELKAIGFDEPTLFHYYENDFDVTIETNSYYDEGEAQGYLHFYISAFKEESFNRYKKCISIPTWEQVFEWFRKKGYNIVIDYIINTDLKCDIGYLYEITYNYSYLKADCYFKTYEEVREECLKELIKIYKNEQL